ncbi:MAG TPA: efflux RND transporter periplasmic adaptor subunit [Acetobacteraceae bacterium]|nr:efflux RND transporter periplasmic adaptor subunit [Acetobacteraceae bacterium]
MKYLIALWLALSALPAFADPSVLVQTQMPIEKTLARRLVAYGTIQPAPDAQKLIALATGAQILNVDVAVGSEVSKGQSLLTIGADPASLAQYRQAVSAVSTATADLAHIRALLATHLATNAQADAARQALSDARASLAALTRDGAGAASRAITAPFAGIVTSIPAALGAQLPAGSPLISLARAGAMVALVGLSPDDANAVKVGQRAVVQSLITAAPPMSGRISLVSGMINPRSGLVDATITLGPSAAIIGAAVTANIDIATAHGVAVPRDAVSGAADQHYIFQIKDGKAVKVKVHVVAEIGPTSLLSGAIAPQLPIVVSGNYQLDDGMMVRP